MKDQANYFQLLKNFFLIIPEQIEEINQPAFVAYNIMAPFALLLHASWIPLFWLLDVKPLSYLNIFSVIFFLIATLVNRKGCHLIAIVVVSFEIILHQLIAVIFLGWDAGFQYYIFSIPLFTCLLSPQYKLSKIVATIIAIAFYSILFRFSITSEQLINLNQSVLNFLMYSNITAIGTIFAGFSFFFSIQFYQLRKVIKEEQSKVKEAYGLLSKYVPSQISDTISSGEIDSIWQHNRRKLTLFFSDIKDFTQLTDALEPEDMAAILNEYLSEMNEIINKYQGTLAQVIGDGLYVFFGAPQKTDDEDHAIRCVKMAIDMQIKMKELNKKWYKTGIDEELKIRCGINTGMATVGGYGSSNRKEYTAMGMQVNIAARIESACEPGQITLNHSTYVLVRDHFSFTNKGEIKVKGYHLPLKIYQVELDNTNIKSI